MKLKKILLLIFSTIFILLSINIVEAVEIPENIENVTNEDILNIYDKITEQYSNDEIADMILENKEDISLSEIIEYLHSLDEIERRERKGLFATIF